MSLSPAFRSPLTDFGGAIISHQWGGRCAKFEMRALDCLEAYGLDRGHVKCKDLIEDFKECSLRQKSTARYNAMRAERERQYKAGERSKDNRYSEAPIFESY